jgi:hypothetical protein
MKTPGKKFEIKKTVVLLLIAFSSLRAQTFQWSASWGANLMETAYSVGTDASGNVYTTGDFIQTVDFDPGPGVFTITSTGYDIFVSKLSPTGNLLWAKRMGSAGTDRPAALTLDASGNVYTTGFFIGTADFDPGTGVSNLVSSGPGNDVYISKLDASGNFVWAKSFSGGNADAGYAIKLDALGNIYVTGSFNGTVDFDPGTGTFPLTSAGQSDVFVAKLDPLGNLIWVQKLGGTNTESGLGITVDAAGNVLTIGNFLGTVDFDPGISTFTLSSAGGAFNEDVFISKLDASGNFVWAVKIGNTNADVGTSIQCDAAGDVYTTGGFSSIVDFDPGASTFTLSSVGSLDAFVYKLSSAGNFMWVKQMGGTSTARGNSLFRDASGNLYTTGNFSGIGGSDFDPGPGVFNLTAVGSFANIFISVLDPAGNFLTAYGMGGTSSAVGSSIAVDGPGNIIASGYFYGTCDFDPTPGTYTLTSPNSQNDAFVVKLGPTPTGIKESMEEISINIYPNPFSSQLTIEHKNLGRQARIKVYNSTGHEVHVEAEISQGKITINRGELTQGVYFFNISENNSSKANGKFLLE